MKNTCISCKPGDTVQLAGIDFVVLEDRGPFSGEGESHDLFILALEGQGTSRFGDTNNYAESDLKNRVDEWLYRLTEKMAEQGLDDEIDLIRSRTISLTTLDGYERQMKQAETLVAQVPQAELMDEQQLNREVTDIEFQAEAMVIQNDEDYKDD